MRWVCMLAVLAALLSRGWEAEVHGANGEATVARAEAPMLPAADDQVRTVQLLHRANHLEGQSTAQTGIGNVGLRLSGIVIGGRARYAVVFQRPVDQALDKVRVEVTLPADAEVEEVATPPATARFEGIQDGRLAWSIERVESGRETPPLIFFLSRPVAGALLATLTWDGAAEPLEAVAEEELPTAEAVEAVITLSDGDQLQRAGDTGVLMGPTPAALAGQQVTIRRLGADANPPEADGPDTWWCAMVEVEGDTVEPLPLRVATRQPLSPESAVAVFKRTPDGWLPLSDAAMVTADGQFISFAAPALGGVFAFGVSAINRPVPVLRAAASPTPDMFVFGGLFDPASLTSGVAATYSVLVQNLSSVTSPAGLTATVTFDQPFTITGVPAGQNATCTQLGARQLSCTLTPLAFGAGAILVATVLPANAGPGTIQGCALASVTVQSGETNTANNSEQKCASIINPAQFATDMSITAMQAAAVVNVGSTGDVQVVVKNLGPANFTDIFDVTISGVTGLSFPQSQPQPQSQQSTSVQCQGSGGGTAGCVVGGLATGASVSVFFKVQGVTVGTGKCVTATVSVAGDPVSGNNSRQSCLTVVDPVAAKDVAVSLSQDPSSHTQGQTQIYRATATLVSGAQTTPFTLTISLGGGVRNLRFAPGQGAGCQIGGSSVTCTLSTTRTTPGSLGTVEVRADLPSPCGALTFSHSASVTSSGDSDTDVLRPIGRIARGPLGIRPRRCPL